jgi:selenocysteine lyase/cysteine desulfurase
MNSVIRNIPYVKGQHALTISEEFPSCYYTAQRWCRTHGAELKVVVGKEDVPERGADWNERILEAIKPETAFLVMASIHWMNGTKFDLQQIGQRCREVGARLIVDGSQSVGALPINLRQLAIDALVCAGYKWLMGPYSTALSYIHEGFNQGIPLEESWMSRPGADKFESLTDYTQDYKPGAARFDMGQSSNFISVPMMNEALRQLLEWGVTEIQEYCRTLSAPFISFCEQHGVAVDEEAFRAHHLLGIQMPGQMDGDDLLKVLQERRIFVSLRGNNLRVSFHLFNHDGDIRQLMEALMQ